MGNRNLCGPIVNAIEPIVKVIEPNLWKENLSFGKVSSSKINDLHILHMYKNSF